jgi:hypothetical protein
MGVTDALNLSWFRRSLTVCPMLAASAGEAWLWRPLPLPLIARSQLIAATRSSCKLSRFKDA